MVKASINLPSIMKKWASSSLINENNSLKKSVDALKTKKINFLELKAYEEFIESIKYEADLEKTKVKHLLNGTGFDKTGEIMYFGGF
jgi:hypothetical protein